MKNLKKGQTVKFKDCETWIVVKDTNSQGNTQLKPYCNLAKENNISLAICFTAEYLKDNKC